MYIAIEGVPKAMQKMEKIGGMEGLSGGLGFP